MGLEFEICNKLIQQPPSKAQIESITGYFTEGFLVISSAEIGKMPKMRSSI